MFMTGFVINMTWLIVSLLGRRVLTVFGNYVNFFLHQYIILLTNETGSINGMKSTFTIIWVYQNHFFLPFYKRVCLINSGALLLYFLSYTWMHFKCFCSPIGKQIIMLLYQSTFSFWQFHVQLWQSPHIFVAVDKHVACVKTTGSFLHININMK